MKARRFRIEVEQANGELEVIPARTKAECLKWTNSVMREGARSCRVFGGGKLVSAWTVTESKLTDEQRMEGRMAFMDDLTIKAVTG